MQKQAQRRGQILGCILGGALGDAWGGPWEGNTGPITFQVPTRPSVSDDTQLTLATCEAIIEGGGVKPEILASHFAKWFAAGRISGIGASTLKAMRDLVAGVHWALAGSRGEYSAGNGAAMRIAPVAFLLDPARSDDRMVIRDVCRITHYSEEAYVGALAVVVAIRLILAGSWSRASSLLAQVAKFLPDSVVRDRIREFIPLNIPPSQVAARFGASGWVVDSVPLALYCSQFVEEQPLSAVLTQAIEAGGDTDTIASIAGQIAGTATGFASDDARHFSRVVGADEIVRVAQRFADFLESG
jgi:ADP-ribosylglycohydrolase